MKLANTSPAFALDPTLPWLFSDPKMQEPAAFRNIRTLTLPEWEPMGLYFPTGTKLAMRLVTDLDQLTVGAAYWSEHEYTESDKKRRIQHCFGRYVAPTYPESTSAKRRWKKGEAHITLESDVLDGLSRNYCLTEQGTTIRFVDAKQSYQAVQAASPQQSEYRLYQITHYIDLPAQQLASLGVEAVKQTGLTLRQAVWLEQEQLIHKGGWEITTHTIGGHHPCDYRVVMAENQALHDFQEVWSNLIHFTLTPGEAKRCKSGTVAITYRSTTHSGHEYIGVEHYKVADVAPLLDWLRTHSELQRLKVEAAIYAQQMGHRAEACRAQRAAFLAEFKAQRALQAASQTQGTLEALRPDYASIQELAHAA
ncbi:MAG: hypothetical protein ACRYFZ_01760 [Janthinobacterium lividum]